MHRVEGCEQRDLVAARDANKFNGSIDLHIAAVLLEKCHGASQVSLSDKLGDSFRRSNRARMLGKSLGRHM